MPQVGHKASTTQTGNPHHRSGATHVPEVKAAGSHWVPGQTRPCAAVTSTGKLLLQLLCPLSTPNHIVSWPSRPQHVPICQEGWAPLCFGNTVTTKCRYFLPEISKFRCSQSKKLRYSTQSKSSGPFELHDVQLLTYETDSLPIHYHLQVPIQSKLTFTCSSDYRVVSGRAQLCRVRKTIHSGQMRPENTCITLTFTYFCLLSQLL